MKALVEAKLIAVDPDAEYVLVQRWFKHNPPMNRDHVTGTRTRIAAIESDVLRGECEASFTEAEAALEQRLTAAEVAKAVRVAKTQHVSRPGGVGWQKTPQSAGLADTAYLRRERRN
jgi:hypothetical protein